jgi:imidazolonepropionase-like amidohydrolase
MNRLHVLPLALLAVFSMAAADPAPAPPLAITHVTVVDVTGAGLVADRTVVVAGGRIVAVTDSAEAKIPDQARVVEGRGKYLIPGLWDMHVHLGDQSDLPLFVANGVTGVRVMWGNPPSPKRSPRFHFEIRDQINAGKLVGPRLVVASNILDGARPMFPGSVAVATAEEGRKAVRAAKESGADFIKVLSLLSRENYLAIAAEAKAQGLPMAGHVPAAVSAREASDVGQKSIEHLYGIEDACSSEADAIRKETFEAIEAMAMGKNPEELRASIYRLHRLRSRVVATYSDDLAAELFARFKKNGTWVCPTLTVLRAMGSLNDAAFTADPRLKYVSPSQRSSWDPKKDFRFKMMNPEDFEQFRMSYERGRALVGKMRMAGVEFLAGTDQANPYCFPGFSLHDELGLLVGCGLSPMEALQTATINPARFLGQQEPRGTVAAGADADLVLLDADPLSDIANTRRINAVVVRGRLVDRAELDSMLSEAEMRAANEKPEPEKPK